MSYKTCILDWRGGNADFTKPADLYSIPSTAETRPVLGNPKGRVLVAISATVMFQPDGQPSTRPYNLALVDIAKKYGAMTDRIVWPVPTPANSWQTRLVDLTKRGVIRDWLALLDRSFPWADGFHIDYFSAWSWLFPDMVESDPVWDRVYAGLASALRGRGKIVVGQQFHLTEPVMATNGLFLEVDPTSFRYTMEKHAEDIAAFRAAMKWADPLREAVWISELRDPPHYPASYIAAFKDWADVNGIYVSAGRDSTAGQVL